MVKAESTGVKIKENEGVNVVSYIHTCIKHLKSKTETIDYLANTYNIEAPKTAAVWEKMEEENEEFFEVHYNMILVKQRLSTLHMLSGMRNNLIKQIDPKPLVLRYIERCIQRVMTKDETIKFLAFHCNIDADLTRAGWKKIKGDNK